jgi:acyl dehydratase
MRHLEDVRVGEVHDLGRTRLSESEIRRFARSYDPQVPHLDGAIASGWQVAGAFMRMYVDAVLRDTAVDLSPGVDELFWLRPVRPGDVLSGRVMVLDVAPSLSRPDCGVVRQRGELSDDRARPVMRMIFYSLVRRRVMSSA